MSRKTLFTFAVLFTAVLAVASTAGVLFTPKNRRLQARTSQDSSEKQIDRIKREPKVPPLNSKTRRAGIYIEGAEIDETFPGGTLVITVRNDTDRDVAAFQLQVEDKVEGTQGAVEAGQPPAIGAWSTAKVRIPLPNLKSLDSPVILNAVIFVDGSEVGDSSALTFIKNMRGKVQEAHANERQAKQEKGVPR